MRTETASVTAPLPVFGLRGLWEIAPKWYIDAQAQYFTLEVDNIDGEVTDLRAGITWMFAKHWGLGAGYNRFVTDVGAERRAFTGDLKWKYSGAQVFITASYWRFSCRMCGRYVSPEESAIEREFTLVGTPGAHPFPASFNVAPTQQVPVIWMREGRRELVRMRFGLIPFFAKGQPGQYTTINARVETVRDSPAYRTAWNRGQRCLVVATGFYEWQVVGEGKQPWFVSCADQPVFGFAGLWDRFSS